MHRTVLPSLLAPLLLLAAAVPLRAQATTPPVPRDPLDARAAVPALSHVSALARYRPAGPLQDSGWKEANDTVARIGGWRAYAREASQPDTPVPAPARTPTSASASAPAAHGKH